MRKNLLIVLLTCVTFGMLGCNDLGRRSADESSTMSHRLSVSNDSMANAVSRINDVYQNVIYTIDQNVFAGVPEVIHTTVINQSKEEICTSSAYLIWRLEGIEWIPLEMDGIVFDQMMYPIGSGEGVRFDIDLYSKMIHYIPGVYRISKTIVSDLETFYIHVEFEIK